MKVFRFFLLCICVLALSACDKAQIIPEPEQEQESEWDLTGYPIGERFIWNSPLMSWQTMLCKSLDEWRQIVTDRTQFELGEAETEPFDKHQIWPWSTKHLRYRQSYGTFPAMDGSVFLMPMAQAFVWQFIDFEDTFFGMRDFLNFSHTADAYYNLIHEREKVAMIPFQREVNVLMDEYWFFQRPDIVLSTQPTTAELNMAAAAGVELISEPIGFDAFVFITHRDNPVDNLTIEQIRGIYSGRITNWKEVGGNDEKIVAYQHRTAYSSWQPASTKQLRMEELMQGLTMIPPQTERVPGGCQCFRFYVDRAIYFQNNPNSLGFTYKFYLNNIRNYSHQDVKILKVNGVMPTAETIRDGSYPLTTPYFATIRAEDVEETGGRFLSWILSDEGQATITQAGYVSLW